MICASGRFGRTVRGAPGLYGTNLSTILVFEGRRRRGQAIVRRGAMCEMGRALLSVDVEGLMASQVT